MLLNYKPPYEIGKADIKLNNNQEIRIKKCSGCKKILPWENFSSKKKAKDGLQNKCKSCKRKYNQTHSEERIKYYLTHQDQIKKYRKAHSKEMKTYFKIHHKKRYEANREKVLALNKSYKETHREEIKAYNKKYWEFHKKELRLKRKLFHIKKLSKNKNRS